MRNKWQFVVYFAISSIFLITFFSDDAEALDVDLEPVNFTFNPEYPINGEVIEITFDVVNNGEEAANQVKIIVWNSTSECDLEDECFPVYETTASVIDKNKQASIEFTCKPDGEDGCGGVGDKVLTVSVDYEDDIIETNEDNNKIVFEYTIYAEELADLHPSEGDLGVMFTPGTPAVGDSVDILALFQNGGRDDCVNFYIKFEQSVNGESSVIGEYQVRTIISPGDPGQYNITWEPDEVGLFEITITLDSNNGIEEFDETDNSYSAVVNVREHTPELTLNEFRNLTVTPNDNWLEEIFTDHNVNLTTFIVNNDYVVAAESVRVGFYDLPENAVNETLIGYAIIDTISNATRHNDEILGGTEAARVTWSSGTGTNIVGNHTIIVRIDPDNDIAEWNEDDNNFSFQLVVLESKPDINMYDLFVVGEPIRGIPSEIVITIFNEGATYVSKYPVEMRIDGELLDTWEVTINQGEFLNLSITHTWDSQQPSISARGDPASFVDELDKSNNVNSLLVYVAAPEYDFSIVDISSNDPVFKGDHIEVVLEIKNNRAAVPDLKFFLFVGNSSAPEFQEYDLNDNPVYYHSEEDLGYNETRLVSIFWRTTSNVGEFNLTVVGEISGSQFEDLNQTDNVANITVIVKPRNFQLSVEMKNVPSVIYLNQTLDISVSALNVGPEICCECPDGTMNISAAATDCKGAEISLFINGEMVKIFRTDPIGRVNGETIQVFSWTPTEPGQYLLEAIIDPDNIVDEYDETDNKNSAMVNVTIEEFVEDEPVILEDSDSLINEPLVWVPLIGLSLAGLGMFIYNRIGDGGDYLDYYEDSNDTNIGGLNNKQSGFRYDPETGETIDMKTGEIIQQGGKENQ